MAWKFDRCPAGAVGWLLLAMAAVSGCAGASVSPGNSAGTLPAASSQAPRPAQIVIRDFSFSNGAVIENQGIVMRVARNLSSEPADQREQAIGSQAASDLSDALVREMTPFGIPVAKAAGGAPLPDNALVIDGQFVNLDQGNRLRRLAIGLGAGASVVNTKVQVFQVADGAQHDLLDFYTHSDSGKMPGAAMTMGAGAAAQGGLTAGMMAANAGLAGAKTYTSQLSNLTNQTAREIAAYLSQYMGQRGWITSDQVRTVREIAPPSQ